LIIQPALHQTNGICHITKLLFDRRLAQLANVRFGTNRKIHFHPACLAKAIRHTQRFRHHKNIAKDNRRIESKSADWLQRHFRRQLRSLRQFKKTVSLL
jgi:hypothetical protein